MAARIGSLYVNLLADMSGFQSGMTKAAGVAGTTSAKIRRDLGLTEASINSLNRAGGRGFDFRGALIASKSFETMNSRVALLRGTLLATTTVMGGLGTALGANLVSRYADQFTSLQNQLRTTSKSAAELGAQTDAVAAAANRSRSSLGATGTLFTRLFRADSTSGPDKILRRVETIQKALALGGATAQEAESAAIQFSQAIQSGKLGGDELRAVLETPLGGQLAKGLGVTIARMREMSKAGELTSAVVLPALDKIAAAVDRDFGGSVATLDQSLQILDNNLTNYIGNTDKAFGVTKAMSSGIQGLANNLDTLIPTLTAVAGFFATTFAGRRIGSAGAGIYGRVKGEFQERQDRAKAAREIAARDQMAARDAAERVNQLRTAEPGSFASGESVKAYQRAIEQRETLARKQAELASSTAMSSDKATPALKKVQELDAERLTLLDRQAAATRELAQTGLTTTPKMLAAARAVKEAEDGITDSLAKQDAARKALKTSVAPLQSGINAQATRLTSLLGQQSQTGQTPAKLSSLQSEISQVEGAIKAMEKERDQVIAAGEREIEQHTRSFVDNQNRLAAARADSFTDSQKKIVAGLREQDTVQAAMLRNEEQRAAAVMSLTRESAEAENKQYDARRAYERERSGARTGVTIAATQMRESGVENQTRQVNEAIAAHSRLNAAASASRIAMESAASGASKVGMAWSLLKVGGASLLAFLGGPWGIALTAATAGLAYLAGRAQESSVQTERLNGIMQAMGIQFEATGGRIDAATKSLKEFNDAQLRTQQRDFQGEIEKEMKTTYGASLLGYGPSSLGDVVSTSNALSRGARGSTNPIPRDAATQVLKLARAAEDGSISTEKLNEEVTKLAKFKYGDQWDKLLQALLTAGTRVIALNEALGKTVQQMNTLSTGESPMSQAKGGAQYRQGETDSMKLYEDAQAGVPQALAQRTRESLRTEEEQKIEQRAQQIANELDKAGKIISMGAARAQARTEIANEKQVSTIAGNTDDAIKGFVDRVVKAEYGSGKVYKNPNSTAAGAGQFIDSTWLDQFRKAYPEQSGMSDSAILDLRKDMDISRHLIETYAKENATTLQKAGVGVTESALQLAHFLGAGDAAKVLKAAPGTPLAGLISAKSIAANQSILGGGKTVDDAKAYADRRSNDVRIAAGDLTRTERDSYDADEEIDKIQEDKQNAVRDILASMKEEVANIDAETAAIGGNTAAKAKAQAVQDALNKLTKEGVTVTPQLRAAIEQDALAIGKKTQALEDQKDAQDRLDDMADGFRDAAREGLGTLISDLRSGKSLTDAMTNAVGRLADRLSDMVLDNAISAIFGKGGGGMAGGGLGSVLAGLFSGGGGISAGATSAIGAGAAGLFHSGGVVGRGSRFRSISPLAFAGAPRFHGGLSSEEFPAILQRGERVLTDRQSGRVASTMNGLASAVRDGGGNASPKVVIEDHRPAGSPDVEEKRERDPSGAERLRLIMRGEIQSQVGDSGSDTRRQLDRETGLKKRLIRR